VDNLCQSSQVVQEYQVVLIEFDFAGVEMNGGLEFADEQL
jgi:hypothetical protein